KEALERLDRGEPSEQLLLAVRRQRFAVLARFDHLPQPYTLLVAADVLDLVRHRAAVGRPQLRQRVGEGLALHVDAQYFGGNTRHDFRREPEPSGIERRITDGLAAEGVERGREVAEIPESSNERVGSGDVLQVLAGARGKRDGGRGKGTTPVPLPASPFPFSQALRHQLIKPLLSLQQRVEGAEKHAGL